MKIGNKNKFKKYRKKKLWGKSNTKTIIINRKKQVSLIKERVDKIRMNEGLRKGRERRNQ